MWTNQATKELFQTLWDPDHLRQVAEQLTRLQADPRDQRTVAEVITGYLEHAAGELSPHSLEDRRYTLKLFGLRFGSLPVSQCNAVLLQEWLVEHTHWASGYTQRRVSTDIQTVFNWACRMNMIRANPFAAYQPDHSRCRPRRELYADEFLAILRHCHPAYRRFLWALRWTGARPGELAGLQWSMIDWQQGIAVLKQHKTAKKTKKPRILVFPPVALRLLRWMHARKHGPEACELLRLLQAAPERQMLAHEVIATMRRRGFGWRRIYRACKCLGVIRQRAPGSGRARPYLYILPAHPVEQPARFAEYVFQSNWKKPWPRATLSLNFRRRKHELGLPREAQLYGLRHLFVTDAVRQGVNLQALAALVGHSSARMIESVYCHVHEDVRFLHQAAQQALGQTPGKLSPDEGGTP